MQSFSLFLGVSLLLTRIVAVSLRLKHGQLLISTIVDDYGQHSNGRPFFRPLWAYSGNAFLLLVAKHSSKWQMKYRFPFWGAVFSLAKLTKNADSPQKYV